jgi:hypothetical protein
MEFYVEITRRQFRVWRKDLCPEDDLGLSAAQVESEISQK